jgi:hypothetical protein
MRMPVIVRRELPPEAGARPITTSLRGADFGLSDLEQLHLGAARRQAQAAAGS